MTYLRDLEKHPYNFDFFMALRFLERSNPDKPIIGDNNLLSEEIVKLGQEPFVAFPASNLSKFENETGKTPKLDTRFLGFFGPQGALPLTTTLETLNWADREDDSFLRFTEIFSNRFQQLFFRAWANSRPIAHMDRPGEDRFLRYLGSFIGVGVAPFFERDSVEDISKIAYTGMISTEIKSASRLQRFLRGIFKLDIEINERIPSWLEFEADDCGALGKLSSSLGSDIFLGRKVLSINERIRISVNIDDLETYNSFLPGKEKFQKLKDLIIFNIGHRYEFELVLALNKKEAPSVKLGKSGKLGWTSWVAPEKGNESNDQYFRDARIMP